MDVSFRQATPADIPQMIALWQLCFPEDDEAFVHRFFDKTPIEQGLLACKGKVLAMLFLLPAEAVVDGVRHSVRYLYAGCTHPDHRREGVFGRLLQFALTFVGAAEESGIYLCPADDALAAYYEKQGYRAGIGGWLCQGTDKIDSLSAVSVGEYMAARDRFLPAELPYFRLAEQAERFFLEELQLDGWRMLTNNSGCCVLAADGTVAYDCLGAFPAASCCGVAPSATRKNTAWWIPTEYGQELTASLENREAYTAFLGDI